MKAVIFDMDGTLVDSVDLHAKAWQQAFAHFGYDISFEDCRSQIGKGGDLLLPFLLSQEEADRNGQEMEKYRGDLFKREYLSQVKPFPDAREMVQLFLSDGWKIALASSAKGDELQIYKKIAQISDLVEAETSSEDAEKSKPHPDIFLAAHKLLGNVPKECCVVIGDSPFDAEAARKAGMQAVGVLCGGFPEEDLRKAGCQAIFHGATDLIKRFPEFKQMTLKQMTQPAPAR